MRTVGSGSPASCLTRSPVATAPGGCSSRAGMPSVASFKSTYHRLSPSLCHSSRTGPLTPTRTLRPESVAARSSEVTTTGAPSGGGGIAASAGTSATTGAYSAVGVALVWGGAVATIEATAPESGIGVPLKATPFRANAIATTFGESAFERAYTVSGVASKTIVVVGLRVEPDVLIETP